jgi:hypothetical protein
MSSHLTAELNRAIRQLERAILLNRKRRERLEALLRSLPVEEPLHLLPAIPLASGRKPGGQLKPFEPTLALIPEEGGDGHAEGPRHVARSHRFG